jgi:hypothetical protein
MVPSQPYPGIILEEFSGFALQPDRSFDNLIYKPDRAALAPKELARSH